MSNYYYLASSLPMLKRNEEAQLTTTEFIDACSMWLSEEEMTLLEELKLIPENEEIAPLDSAIDKWDKWETCLRNRIARARGGKLNRDSEQYCRYEADCFSEIERAVQDALSNPNPLEREKIYHNARWSRLDDIESGHYFDFDMLCVYKIKLMLREKWNQRQFKQGRERLDLITEQVYKPEEKDNLN